MYKLSYLLAIILLLVTRLLQAQTIHVNAATGNDAANGKVETPVATLQRAIELAKTFKTGESVTINGLPRDYLNPLPNSAGKELNAGIFKK